jgi:hypothetical protein
MPAYQSRAFLQAYLIITCHHVIELPCPVSGSPHPLSKVFPWYTTDFSTTTSAMFGICHISLAHPMVALQSVVISFQTHISPSKARDRVDFWGKAVPVSCLMPSVRRTGPTLSCPSTLIIHITSVPLASNLTHPGNRARS